MSASDDRRRAFDKWVIIPTSWAAVLSAAAVGFASKGIIDAANGLIPLNMSDIAVLAAVIGFLGALASSWLAGRRKERRN